jgi:hypothetical protein
LSGFDDPEAQKRLHEHDTVDPALIDKETGKPKKVFVPILKPENFGENMTTDDKNIGGEVYTAISNKDTGKDRRHDHEREDGDHRRSAGQGSGGDPHGREDHE